MVVPGPIQNLNASAGNNSVVITFRKPLVGQGPFTYIYTFAGALALPVDYTVEPTDSDDLTFTLVSDDITPGSTVQVVVYARNSDGEAVLSDWVTSNSVTILGASSNFDYVHYVGVDSLNVSDAESITVNAGVGAQYQLTADDSLPANTASADFTFETTAKATFTVGGLDKTDPNNAIATAAADDLTLTVGGVQGVTFAVLASEVDIFGNSKELVETVETTIEQQFSVVPPPLAAAAEEGEEIIGTVYRYNGTIYEEMAKAVAEISATLAKLVAKLPFKRSIYVIIYTVSDGTTVTVPVENNQAYNNYLHDESGYQNRRENRLLTSGFYRGPVDSSTLTRIRSANGVLRGVPGIPGGMQGSRCCP
jgi:hypothetical protein